MTILKKLGPEESAYMLVTSPPACQGQEWDLCADLGEVIRSAGGSPQAELTAVPQITSQVQAASMVVGDSVALDEQSIPVKRVARKSGGLEWPSLPSRQEVAAATGAANGALQPSKLPDAALGAILKYSIPPNEQPACLYLQSHHLQSALGISFELDVVPKHNIPKGNCQGITLSMPFCRSCTSAS